MARKSGFCFLTGEPHRGASQTYEDRGSREKENNFAAFAALEGKYKHTIISSGLANS